jgi:parallel beta-helix repeat protein
MVRGSFVIGLSLMAMSMLVAMIACSITLSDAWRGAGGAVDVPARIESYVLHDPIYIDGDDQFTADNGVVEGSGILSDPYVISGWEIGPCSEDGIAVLNTRAHFVVKEVYVHEVTGFLNVSLFFSDVHNGSIQDSVFSQSSLSALAIASCEDVSVTNNTISYCDTGVWIFTSSNTTVARNNISECVDGAYSYISDEVNITGNNITLSSQHGVYLSESSDVDVTRNNISDVLVANIYVNSSESVCVSENLLSVVSEGVHVYGGSDVLVADNDIVGAGPSTTDGIRLAYSTGHTVYNNTVRDVSVGVHAYVSDSSQILACNLSGGQDGIQLTDSDDCLISGNNASDNWVGINLYLSSDCSVEENIVKSNYYGIRVGIGGGRTSLQGNDISWNEDTGLTIENFDSDCEVRSNTVEHNGLDGILIYCADRAFVLGNLVSHNEGNGIGLFNARHATLFKNELVSDGIVFADSLLPQPKEYFDSHTIADNNTVNGRPVLYMSKADAQVVDGSDAGQIILANCTDISLSHAEIEDTDIAVQGFYVNDSSLDDIMASACDEAVHLKSSRDCDLTHHVLIGNEVGLSVMSSDGVSISFSNMSENTLYALAAMENSHISVLNCSVVMNEEGVSLFYTDNSTVFGNRIIANVLNGVLLYYCENTLVYHNSFIGNGIQADETGGHSNHWNSTYPAGGNYWDDYSGVDINSGPDQDVPGADGIGDTPYVISGPVMDYYPLIESAVGEAPVAVLHVSPPLGDTTTLFSFDASDSWDLEDDDALLEVRWDWDNDGTWDTDWSTEKTATHQYATPGTYTVKVEVRDSSGLTDAATVEVEVVEVIPEFGSIVIPALTVLAVFAALLVGRRPSSRT